MIRDREQYTAYANADLISSLLSVLDNFERALDSGKSVNDAESFYRGVEMIYEELRSVLGRQGLEQLVALGQEFNPERHEAVVAVESDSHPPNVVIEEIQKGYILKDRVIRPSRVAVSKSRSKEVGDNGESNRN
jgi:molecular chaperone GrpE